MKNIRMAKSIRFRIHPNTPDINEGVIIGFLTGFRTWREAAEGGIEPCGENNSRLIIIRRAGDPDRMACIVDEIDILEDERCETCGQIKKGKPE